MIFRTTLTDILHLLIPFFSYLAPPHHLLCVCVCTGYGFVDFDSPAAAQKAVASLKASGVQAQMAKVSPPPPFTLWSALHVTEVFGFFYSAVLQVNSVTVCEPCRKLMVMVVMFFVVIIIIWTTVVWCR